MANLNIILPIDTSFDKGLIQKSIDSIKSVTSPNIGCIILYHSNNDIKDLNCNGNNIRLVNKKFSNFYLGFNRGIQYARAEYVMFIRPGDYLDSSIVSCLQDVRDEDIISFYYSIVSDGIKMYVNKNELFDKPNVYDTSITLPRELNVSFNKIYKKSIIKDCQILFNDAAIDADYIFNINYLVYAKTFKASNNYAVIHTLKNNKVLTDNEKAEQSGITYDSVCGLLNVATGRLKDSLKKKKSVLAEFIFCSNIDFVFPYVTSDDPIWRKLYKEHLKGDESAWEAGVERFRDNGLLKYVFRSIEVCMPWIRNVCMIVMSEDQVPSWVNTENVKIITHDMFIPKSFQPVFNSTTIEMFLSKIPYVADQFIYSNDDLLTFKKLSPECFFINGDIPSYQLTFRNFKAGAPADENRKNCYNLIMNTPNNETRVVATQHGPISYRMPYIKDCTKKYETQMRESCTPFRTDKNLNQYVFALYQMMYEQIDNDKKDIVSYAVTKHQFKKIIEDDFSKHDFICINDDNSSTQAQWNAILSKIDNYFPIKSKYEL